MNLPSRVVRLIRIEPSEDGHGVVGDVATLGEASSGKWAEAAKAAALDDAADAIPFVEPQSVSIDGAENVYVIDARTATVVTRPEETKPQVVGLAAEGSLGQAVSLTIEGTRALVLDGSAADAAQAVREVTVGAPHITSVTPEEDGLEGGATVVVEGENFAPETTLTLGDAPVTDYTVESATRIEFVVPGQTAPGARTLSVVTRGGVDQRAFSIDAKRVLELAAGEITNVAGGVAYVGDGGSAVGDAVGLVPLSTAVDGAGNLFIVDYLNNRIRRVDAATGVIPTVAGTGQLGFGGDGGPATSTSLNYPNGVAVDGAGNLFIADLFNNRIRRVDAATGVITTFAGTGSVGRSGDDGPATSASLNSPAGLAIDKAGNLFIADSSNDAIRVVKGPITDGGDAAPSIQRVVFHAARPRLTITGSGFAAAGAQVRVNGSDVSAFIAKQMDLKLTLRVSAQQPGLRSGPNQITVTVDGQISNLYVLTR
jgi:hypothetical protein